MTAPPGSDIRDPTMDDAVADPIGRMTENRIAAGCMVLFALPFLLAGGIMILAGIVTLAGNGTIADSAIPLFGGIAFFAAGLGIVLAVRYGRRKLEDVRRLRAANPESPWLWDVDWAAGRLRSGGRATVIAAWIFAAIWNGISLPVVFFLPGELDEGNWAALAGLAFPLIGALLFVWAIRSTLRWRRYGTSELILVHNPVPVGGVFAAALRTRFAQPPGRMTFRLSCHERTASGRSGETSTQKLLWEDESVVASDAMRSERGALFIPIVFRIPPDAAPTDRESTPRSVHWRLSAAAKVSGIDYTSRFDVPVFRTGEALVESSVAAAEAVEKAEPEALEPFDPSSASVRIAPGPGGATEFRFGAGRVMGAGFGVAFMALVFLGVAYGVRQLDAPGLFTVVFGFFGLMLLAIALDLLLVATVVTIGNNAISIRSTILGLGSTRRIPLEEVEAVDLGIGMTQNESALQNARAWYDIALKLRGGKKVAAGRHIRSRREARWIVSRMRECLESAGGHG